MASERINGAVVTASGVEYRTRSPALKEAVVNPSSLKDWDDEELARGHKRAANGTFVGRPPKIVPKAVHDEAMRRLLERGRKLFASNFEQAIRTMITLANASDVEDAVRLRAATYIVERLAGKTPDRVEVSDRERPFEVLLSGVERDLSGGDSDDPEQHQRGAGEDADGPGGVPVGPAAPASDGDAATAAHDEADAEPAVPTRRRRRAGADVGSDGDALRGHTPDAEPTQRDGARRKARSGSSSVVAAGAERRPAASRKGRTASSDAEAPVTSRRKPASRGRRPVNDWRNAPD